MRTRLAFALLIALVALAAVGGVLISYYGVRVITELRPGSWSVPTTIVDRNGDTLLKVYGAEWRVTDPVILKSFPITFRTHFSPRKMFVFAGTSASIRAESGGHCFATSERAQSSRAEARSRSSSRRCGSFHLSER